MKKERTVYLLQQLQQQLQQLLQQQLQQLSLAISGYLWLYLSILLGSFFFETFCVTQTDREIPHVRVLEKFLLLKMVLLNIYHRYEKVNQTF